MLVLDTTIRIDSHFVLNIKESSEASLGGVVH
jgi:hypothetical protein